MKKNILILFVAICSFYTALSQEIIESFRIAITFEYTSQYQFIQFSNDSVWFIGEPEKDRLSLPGSLGSNAIFTDTIRFYKKSNYASFQFRLRLVGSIHCFEFYQKYDFEDQKDGGIIETSYDGGNTWQNIIHDENIMNNINPHELYNLYGENDTIAAFGGQPGFTGTFLEGGYFGICWYEYEHYLDTFLLRFTFASDSADTENEGWLLDDFSFWTPVEDKIRADFNTGKLLIWPNPAINEIHLDSGYPARITKIEIYSFLGNLISEKYVYSETIDISDLNPGFYILRCFNEGNFHITGKLIKK